MKKEGAIINELSLLMPRDIPLKKVRMLGPTDFYTFRVHQLLDFLFLSDRRGPQRHVLLLPREPAAASVVPVELVVQS
jgi:hypothetical protein